MQVKIRRFPNADRQNCARTTTPTTDCVRVVGTATVDRHGLWISETLFAVVGTAATSEYPGANGTTKVPPPAFEAWASTA